MKCRFTVVRNGLKVGYLNSAGTLLSIVEGMLSKLFEGTKDEIEIEALKRLNLYSAQHIDDVHVLIEYEKEEVKVETQLTFADAVRIAHGCLDYGGGFSGSLYGAFQGGIQTVIQALEGAEKNGLKDTQTVALWKMGKKDQEITNKVVNPMTKDKNQEIVNKVVNPMIKDKETIDKGELND